jgi:hypothetical protein
VLLLGADTVLRVHAAGARLYDSVVTARAADYLRITQDDRAIYFLSRDGKDTMTQTALAQENGVWPETLDRRNPALAFTTYHTCARPPVPWAGLNEDGLTAVTALPLLRVACATDNADPAPCAHALSRAFDRDGDGMLDYAETARLWRGALFVAATRDRHCPFGDSFPGDSRAQGPQFAARLMAVADTDRNARLSATELQQNVARLDTLLPALRGEEPQQKTCRP